MERAVWKRVICVSSMVGDSVTGSLRVNFWSSSMHDFLQICHVALAEKVKVSPGASEAGGVISMRKAGEPE